MELAFNFGGQNITPPRDIPHGNLSYLSTLLSNFLTIFIIAGAVLMVIYIVWAGIQWITSGGDKQKLTTARGRLIFAIVGFIIILTAILVINAIGFFFKVNLLRLG